MAQDLSFAISLDLFMDRNFDSQFKGLNNALSQTAEKVKALSDTSAKLTGFASMAEKCQKLTASTGEAQTKLDGLKSRAAELDGYMARNAENTAQLSSRYQALKSEADRLSSSGQKNTAMYQKVAQRMKQVKAEIKGSKDEGKRLADMQKSLSQESSKLERSLNADTEALEKMKAELQSAGIDTNNLAAEQDRLQQELAQTASAQENLAKQQARVNQLKENVSWSNIKGTAIGAFAAYKSLEAPVKTSMDFEAAMQRVKAVSFSSDDADMSKFEMLKAQAKQLGAETQFSATQAAQTQENLARGGFDPDQIKAAMPAVLAMAAAEGMDLAQAGDIVVKTIGGMGLKATDAGMVADLLANVSANAATNIAEVGEGMKIAAPVLSQLGVTIDQVGAYLGGMANKGFTGSEAGNALASSAMRLSKMPTETAKALNSLGVPIKTKDGKLRELPDIMIALKSAFDKRKMGEAERMDAMARIFGQGHGKAMLGFMEASVSGDIAKLETSNRENKTGKAQRMADIQLDTLAGQLTVLGSAWEGLQISIGDIFAPVVRSGVEMLASGISKLNEVITNFPVASKNIAMFIAALAGAKAAKNILNIGKSLMELPFALMKLQGAGNSAAETLSTVGNAGAGLTGAFSGVSSIGGAFKALWGIIAANPFAAILTVGGLIYANWDTIKTAWHGLVDWWNNLDLANLWEGVNEYVTVATDWAKSKWKALADWWDSWTLNDVFAVVAPYADTAVQAAKSVLAGLSDWWDSWTLNDVFSVVKDYAAKAWEWYTWPGRKLREWLSTFELPDVFASLSDMASKAVDSIMGIFSGLGDWIMNTIGKLNPFNWEMPSWLGGGQTPAQTQARHDRGQQALNSAFGAPSFEVHATGGILTRPHMGLVAEAGAEAIIPLTDRSRGLQVLGQAAEILGVQIAPDSQISSVSSSTNTLSNVMNSSGANTLSSIMNRTENMNSLRESMIDLSHSIERSNDYVSTSRADNRGGNSRIDNRNSIEQPTVNITVNADGNNDSQGLAELIAQKFNEAWQELQERQARLDFA